MTPAIQGTIVALFVVLAAGAGYWFGNRSVPIAPSPAPAKGAGGGPSQASPGRVGGGGGDAAVSVETAAVALARLPQAITAVGSLRSDESVTLRPEVAGRIRTIEFREGQRVGKGATLVRLDAAVNQAELEQARANLKLAKSKFDRAVDLSKSNFISGQAKDEAENNLRVAEAAVSLVEARLAKMEIQAPFSGIIGLRLVSIGDYVKEGADLVNLESIDPLKVDFRVPEVYMRQVESGQPLEVALDAYPGKTFQGRVLAVNPLIDAAGRAVVIRAQVKNQDASLRPGMFARVRLIVKDVADALVVPEQALVPQGNEQFVYKVIEGRAVRTQVEIGQRRDGKAEVLTGLRAGEVVVTAGQQRLRDGATVALRNAAGEPASAAAAEGTVQPAKADNLPPAKATKS